MKEMKPYCCCSHRETLRNTIPRPSRQKGFTLVEIAIVLVIIGLLLGGVLKGQEIIKNANIKNLENDFNGTTAAIYSYQDRYRSLPGDDKKVKTRFPDASDCSTAASTCGNNKIEGEFDSTTATDESNLFWQHLRLAGLVKGDSSSTDLPLNAFKGVVGVSSVKPKLDTGAKLTGTYIGFSRIPREIAIILESRADDNNPNTGTIYANAGESGSSDGAAISGTTTYPADKLVYNVFFAL
jgi:prepilin-type N-terminal cleavage/methylation domain-containing protein